MLSYSEQREYETLVRKANNRSHMTLSEKKTLASLHKKKGISNYGAILTGVALASLSSDLSSSNSDDDDSRDSSNSSFSDTSSSWSSSFDSGSSGFDSGGGSFDGGGSSSDW